MKSAESEKRVASVSSMCCSVFVSSSSAHAETRPSAAGQTHRGVAFSSVGKHTERTAAPKFQERGKVAPVCGNRFFSPRLCRRV